MRRISTLATAGLAELAAHFLSLTWGFAILIGAFCVVASLLRTTSAKAYTTEARLNGHIIAAAPAIALQANGGTIGGDLTISGNGTTTGAHTVQGNFNAHNGISYNNGLLGDTLNVQGPGNSIIGGLNVSSFTNTKTLQVNSTQMFIPFTDEGDQSSVTVAAFNALLDRLRGSNLMA